MRRTILRIITVILALLALGVLALGFWASWVFDRDYAHVPAPPIVADHSAEGVERGALLFQSLCMECHGAADGRATGKHLAEVPAFFGKLYSANLAHPSQGVHARSDRELVRVLRTGVLPSGRFSLVMSTFNRLGDQDVAALLGYLRSSPPELAIGGSAQPPSELSTAARLLLALTGAKVDVTGGVAPLPVPVRAASVEYGRYMAQAMDCVGCHTAGLADAEEKMRGPLAFAGGGELTDPTGTPIFSKNITFDRETGMGRYSLEDFERALTRGVTREGFLVRKPMPLFSRFERIEVEALYRFLQTVPHVRRANQPGGHELVRARREDSAQALFANVGCGSCHGRGAPYEEKIRAALGKSDDEVAAWILDPQAKKPGSAMPSFAAVLEPGQAVALARYVKQLGRGDGR